MGIWDHYPDIKRRWRPYRCICGFRLWRCPDWNARVARQRANYLGHSEVTS